MQSVPESNVLTVSGLNRLAKSLLEGHFPAVRVEGEISNLSRPSSGHWYFTLKDQSAQLRCAMFAGNNRRVQFKADSGQQVTVRGRLSIYEGRGDYQLIVDSMEQAGAGALQRAFELLKTKLEDEGLFRADTKRPLRDDYRHIGLITSATEPQFKTLSACSVDAHPPPLLRYSQYRCRAHRHHKRSCAPLLARIGLRINSASSADCRTRWRLYRRPAGVQRRICGKGNRWQRSRYLQRCGSRNRFYHRRFCGRPSSAYAVGCGRAFESKPRDQLQLLTAAKARLLSLIQTQLQASTKQLTWLARSLKRPDRLLQEQSQHLDRLESQLKRAWRARAQRGDNRLALLERRLQAQSPSQRLLNVEQQLLDRSKRLTRAIRALVTKKSSRLGQLTRSLDTVSPLATLARGYSISYDAAGALLRSSDQAALGAKMRTKIADGLIVSTIDTIEKETDSLK
jgi:exodeoxyribonuclease VII large subunit